MNMDDKYFRNAQELIDRANERAGKYKGECKDCKFFCRDPLAVRHSCSHPAVELAGFDVDQGYDRKAIQWCDEQRSSRSPFGKVVCGPNGNLFSPRQSEHSPDNYGGYFIAACLLIPPLLYFLLK